MEVPSGTTPEQLARIVVSYIEAQPQRTLEPFMQLALEALYYAWPCRK